MGDIKGFYLMPHAPILIPEIGENQIKNIKNTFDACHQVASDIAKQAPDTIIMITPQNTVFNDTIAMSSDDVIYGNFETFGNAQIGMERKINKEITDKIAFLANENKIPTVRINKNSAKVYGASVEIDHGTMVPLYFINQKYKTFNIVNITYGSLTKLELYRFGMIIKKAVQDSKTNTVLIASGDFSHCLNSDETSSYDEGQENLDKVLIKLLENGEVTEIFNIDNSVRGSENACGLKSCYIMLGALSEYNIRGKLLSYEAPFGGGYGVMMIEREEKASNIVDQVYKTLEEAYERKQNHDNPFIRLARQAIAYYHENSEYMMIPDYVTEDMLNSRQGVFVSIKKQGKLRGCIGTINPTTDNVASEIIKNSVYAAFEDPRFMPVKKDEMAEVIITVDLLTKPEQTIKESLDIKRYGIVVRSGEKSGIILPNIKDIESVDEQIDVAMRKAGILDDEEYKIYRFEVIRHEE